MTMTADHVARAIVAACRITGADPLALPQAFFTGIPGIQRPRTVARALAAAALLEAFPEYRKVAIGRCVGSRTPDVYIAKLRADVRQGKAPWESAEHLAAVVAAINEPEGSSEGRADTAETPRVVKTLSAGPVGRAEPVLKPGPSAPPPRWSDKVSRSAPPSKRALYDMLGDAVRNTGSASE